MPPCGAVDLGLLAVAKRSAAYRAIRSRVATLHPSDSWYEDGLAFVTFGLRSEDGAMATAGVSGAGQAIFVLSPVSQALLAARVVEPSAGGDAMRVRDLLAPNDPAPAPISAGA